MPPSQATDLSLIRRVRNRDKIAWDHFSQIYGPMVYQWGRRNGLQAADARDVAQEVFQSVFASIDNWQPGRFRSWLWTIFQRRLVDFYRRLQAEPPGTGGTTANFRIRQVPDSPPAETSDDGRQDIEELRRRALQIVEEKIDPQHWAAFYRVVINEESATEVAQDLGLSKWVVYKAKTRVMHRLIKEFEGMDFLADWRKAFETKVTNS